MNIEDLSKKRGNEEAVKNQYFNYSNPEADTNLDDLANGVSKTSIAYGSNLDQQTVQGRSNYTDEVKKEETEEGDSGRIMSDQVFINTEGKVTLPFFSYKSNHTDEEAMEGGWRSGKKGHMPYMKSIEFGGDYKDCKKCNVNVTPEDGKCPICSESF